MQILSNLNKDFWWDVAKNCEYATFFHTPIWHQLATQSNTDFSDGSVGFVLDSGVRVVLPTLIQNKSGPFVSLLSTFEKCYGGIIADGSVSDGELEEIYGSVVNNFRTIRFDYLENPFAPKIKHGKDFKQEDNFTHIVTLNSDFDTIFSKFAKNQQTSYRKGLSLGVEVSVAKKIDEYQTYFDVYEDSVRRWEERYGFVHAYNWALFENCHTLAQKYPDAIKLWLAKTDDTIISGALVFYWGNHVIGWHGVTHSDYFKYQPFTVLNTEIIRDCIEKGYKVFDFNPSGGFEGVIKFKESFGTEKTEISRWIYENDSLLDPLRKFRDIKGKIISPQS